MSNTLEFTIPDGYELDKEKSTAKKAVYKKVEKYKPKEGDLVVYTHIDWSETYFISLWECDPVITPCVFRSGAMCNDWSLLHDSTGVFGDEIRSATADEAALFSRILSENGYEYDPEKKEVRKKASHIYYIDENIEVCKTANNGCHAYTLRMVGNSFRTREEADEVAAEFRKILNNKKA